jgi:hypothetical protein
MNTTDPDILAVLTPEQMKRRRQLRRRLAAVARKQRREIAAEQSPVGYPSTIYCAGTTENGTACLSKHVMGSIYCVWHMNESERKRLSIRDPHETQRRITKTKAPELMRQIVEHNTMSILRPYFEALGITLEGYDEENGKPIVSFNPNAGLKLYGESKDGDIVMTPYADIGGMVTVAEKLMDRVYGKPKQSTTIEGGVNPVRIQPVKSEERAVEVAAILAQARALPQAASQAPHEGRRRPAPSTGEVIDMDERREHEDD